MKLVKGCAEVAGFGRLHTKEISPFTRFQNGVNSGKCDCYIAWKH